MCNYIVELAFYVFNSWLNFILLGFVKISRDSVAKTREYFLCFIGFHVKAVT